jgi:hypothetical protein
MPCSDLLCSVKRKSETGREKEKELVCSAWLEQDKGEKKGK